MKVAVTSRSFSRHALLRRELLELYPQVTFNDSGASLSGASLVAFLQGHERAITALERLDEPVLSRLPDLRVVSKYGVGLDMIDLAAMSRLGIRLGWSGGVNKRSVSELVVAFAISLLRRIPEGNRRACRGEWQQITGSLLSERVVGIVGLGHVGKDLARVLRLGFGARVLAHDLVYDEPFCASLGVETADLDDLLRRAEIVSLHVPLDGSTRNLLNAERLDFMRADAILVNTARGGLIDEAHLKAMLKQGRLRGAAFDVLAAEPPEDLELLQLHNVMVTPHIGGSAEEAILAMGRAAIANLADARDPLSFA